MFFQWPSNRFVRHLEGRGHSLRQQLKLGTLDALDPRRLIGTYDNMTVLDLSRVDGHADEVAVARRFSAEWSAMAYREDGGVWLITWNPWHAETRIRVSLMEEVAHIILGHAPTKMVLDPATGLSRRTYSASKEKEAYGVAGAALVPYNGIMTLLRSGGGPAEIATRFQVSDQLVQMRLNVTGARRALDGRAA